MSNDEEFSRRLKAAIEAKGLSFVEAADQAKARCSEEFRRSDFFGYLLGAEIPAGAHLSALCAALDISPRDLLGEPAAVPIVPAKSQVNLDEALLSVGRFARACGTTVSAIKTYVRSGVLEVSAVDSRGWIYLSNSQLQKIRRLGSAVSSESGSDETPSRARAQSRSARSTRIDRFPPHVDYPVCIEFLEDGRVRLRICGVGKRNLILAMLSLLYGGGKPLLEEREFIAACGVPRLEVVRALARGDIQPAVPVSGGGDLFRQDQVAEFRKSYKRNRLFRTGEFARECGVHHSTIRLYVRERWIEPVARTPGGQLLFHIDQVARVKAGHRMNRMSPYEFVQWTKFSWTIRSIKTQEQAIEFVRTANQRDR